MLYYLRRACLVIFLFALTATSVQARCKFADLSWAWIAWEPFLFKNQQDQFQGIDYEIVSNVLQRTGCSFSLTNKEIPWRRQLAWLATGKIDLMTGASRTATREQFALFSEPYRVEFVTIFVRVEDKEKFAIKQLAGLLKLDIKGLGYDKGSYYGEEFQRLQSQPEFMPLLHSGNEDSNFNRLIHHRLDAVIADEIAGELIIEQLNQQNTIVALKDFRIATGNIHAMFSKKTTSPEALEQFNQELKKFKETAEYQTILERFRNGKK